MRLEEILERMDNGKLYFCDDKGLAEKQMKALDMQYDYNLTRPGESEKRAKLLREMFAEIGEGCYIEPPLHSNWGGKHVHFGNNVYANFALTLVDDTDIFVGDNVLFGPNVVICAGTHPVDPELRRRQVQYNLPVHIGNNVWLGGGVFVMPGVTIGENSVIGAGSIVTKDIPANVVAVGNPCRVLRSITERDKRFYGKNMPVDID
jgi:galactoside O-acetyltransferase